MTFASRCSEVATTVSGSCDVERRERGYRGCAAGRRQRGGPNGRVMQSTAGDRYRQTGKWCDGEQVVMRHEGLGRKQASWVSMAYCVLVHRWGGRLFMSINRHASPRLAYELWLLLRAAYSNTSPFLPTLFATPWLRNRSTRPFLLTPLVPHWLLRCLPFARRGSAPNAPWLRNRAGRLTCPFLPMLPITPVSQGQ